MTQCGTVAIIGRPNAGKSTLLNRLVGQKVAIVTQKAQTTRFQIQGILTEEETQIIFTDTPGLFDPKRALEKFMVQHALKAMRGADMIVLLINATQPDLEVLEKFKDRDNVCIVVNKIDKAPDYRLPETYGHPVIYISALEGTHLADLKAHLFAHVPEGPWLYPANQVTTLNDGLYAAEITREKAMLLLRQELPYELYIVTDNLEKQADGSLKINQTIIVSRESLKPMVIGKGGAMIKQIGQWSREELAQYFQCPVHLFLFVKVKTGWTEQNQH